MRLFPPVTGESNGEAKRNMTWIRGYVGDSWHHNAEAKLVINITVR